MNYTDYLSNACNYTTSTAIGSFVISAKVTSIIATVTGISTLLVGATAVPAPLAFNGLWCPSFLGGMTAQHVYLKNY